MSSIIGIFLGHQVVKIHPKRKQKTKTYNNGETLLA
jgi:hypothetical protein